MIKKILDKYINLQFGRHLVVFLLIGLFVILLPLAMYIDQYIPRINLPYVTTLTIFFLIPVYFAFKSYLKSKNGNIVVNNSEDQQNITLASDASSEAEKDYGRDIFMGFFTFIFFSFINHVMKEALSLNPEYANYNFSVKTLIPGFFISLYFFRNAYLKYVK